MYISKRLMTGCCYWLLLGAYTACLLCFGEFRVSIETVLDEY